MRGRGSVATEMIWHADQRAKLMWGIKDAKLGVSHLQKKRA
jgi:hypothetical protein